MAHTSPNAPQQSSSYLWWALASVVLISMAQLLLKWGMTHIYSLLPQISMLLQSRQISVIFNIISEHWSWWLAIFVGLSFYAISMACWVIALKHLKLSIAYPLLSLSYVFVYFGAVYLPWLHEPFSWLKMGGILLILAGLFLLFFHKPKT